MRALVFLYVRSLVNGVKRAFSSPTRTIGVLFFIVTQLWWLPRMMFGQGAMESIPFEGPRLDFPPIYVIDGVVFAGFSAVTFVFALNLFGYRGGFRAADVDVLFPTPVDPRTVLILRVLRDIWVTLIMPLFLAVVFWRPAKMGWTAVFESVPHPETANTVFRVAAIAYFLSAIAWVWIGYALSLVFSKPDDRVERWRVALTWGVVGAFLALGAAVYFRVLGTEFPDGLLQVSHAGDIRAVFFMATAATTLTTAPLTGSFLQALVGGGALVGVGAVAVWLALSNTEWMYEQAALRAAVSENSRLMRRTGDMYGLYAKQAESGKIKAGRPGLLSRWTVRGPMAILWKEALTVKRTGMPTQVLFICLSIGMAMLVSSMHRPGIGGTFQGSFLLAMQAILLLGPTMGYAQAGFIESLRRVDLLKPLPFTAQGTVFVEVVSKGLGGWISVAFGLVTAAILRPYLLPFSVAGLLMFPAFTVALSAVSLLLVLLLPDVDDPTQRGFRGLATMLGMLACTAPPIGLFILLVWVGVPIAVAALPTSALMLGLGWLATWFAGKVYEDFNPSE